MLLVDSSWRKVLGPRRISLLRVPMLWLLHLPAGLLVGGSLLIFQCLQISPSGGGELRCLAPKLFTPSGLPAGSTRQTGRVRLPPRLFRMLAIGVVPQDLGSQLRPAHDNSDVDDFWTLWSSGAESGLFRPFSGAGGPVSGGSQMYLGRGRLRIRKRGLGGRCVGGACSSRLHRVSQGDDVDVQSAQYFVYSSLAHVTTWSTHWRSWRISRRGVHRCVCYLCEYVVVDVCVCVFSGVCVNFQMRKTISIVQNYQLPGPKQLFVYQVSEILHLKRTIL